MVTCEQILAPQSCLDRVSHKSSTHHDDDRLCEQEAYWAGDGHIDEGFQVRYVVRITSSVQANGRSFAQCRHLTFEQQTRPSLLKSKAKDKYNPCNYSGNIEHPLPN
jgi:hypothetical protein